MLGLRIKVYSWFVFRFVIPHLQKTGDINMVNEHSPHSIVSWCLGNVTYHSIQSNFLILFCSLFHSWFLSSINSNKYPSIPSGHGVCRECFLYKEAVAFRVFSFTCCVMLWENMQFSPFAATPVVREICTGLGALWCHAMSFQKRKKNWNWSSRE